MQIMESSIILALKQMYYMKSCLLKKISPSSKKNSPTGSPIKNYPCVLAKEQRVCAH